MRSRKLRVRGRVGGGMSGGGQLLDLSPVEDSNHLPEPVEKGSIGQVSGWRGHLHIYSCARVGEEYKSHDPEV